MPKGHRGTGSYVGAVGSYATGGRFSLKEQQIIASNDAWKPPFVSTNLQLFLDAADYSGSGTTWADKSGNGKNFTWTSAPNFTSGTAPYFSTLGKGAVGPASNSFNVANSGEYTVIVVAAINSESYNGAFKFSGDVTNGRGIFSHLNWVGNQVYWDQGGCCNADTRTNVTLGSVSGWNMFVYRRSTTSRDFIKSGTTLISNTSAAASINLNATAAIINNEDQGAGANAWDAKLGAFMLYNRALTNAELTTNLNIFKARYGF